MARFIDYQGKQWRVSHLARAYGLAPRTLDHRIERFGETSTGIARALATGLMSCAMAGRIGATRSAWRMR